MPLLPTFCLALFILLASAYAKDDFISPSGSDGMAQFSDVTQRAFRLESEADFVAWYSTDGKLDIGVGRTDKEQNLHHPIRFTLDEVEGFFDDQRHKGLIIVTVAKHVWTDQELAKHIIRLRDYFVARGYKRIVIEQAYGSGRGIHLEYPEPKPAALNNPPLDPSRRGSPGSGWLRTLNYERQRIVTPDPPRRSDLRVRCRSSVEGAGSSVCDSTSRMITETAAV